MTGQELVCIFDTDEFRAELATMSSALASITQEVPIKHALAKQLYRTGREYALEDKHRDLLIEGAHLEFKFNFDKSVASIEKDLDRWGTLEEMWAAYKSKSRSWSALAKVFEDIAGKEKKHHPDFFVWIVCSRDLEQVDDGKLTKRRVCMWKDQRKYNKKHKYSEGYHRTVISRLIKMIQDVRPCRVDHKGAVVGPADDFESTYDFYVFQFNDNGE